MMLQGCESGGDAQGENGEEKEFTNKKIKG
jgi:hypothetical protein